MCGSGLVAPWWQLAAQSRRREVRRGRLRQLGDGRSGWDVIRVDFDGRTPEDAQVVQSASSRSVVARGVAAATRIVDGHGAGRLSMRGAQSRIDAARTTSDEGGFLMTYAIGASADAPSVPHSIRTRRSARVARAAAAGLAFLLVQGLVGIVPVASAAPVPACIAGNLSARIASWQGAAGSRIADVRIVNTSFTPCLLRSYQRVRLVSAHGTVMINGAAASTTGVTHLLAPLGFLRTEVSDTNYCGPAFVKPATLAFVLPGTAGRVVAMPVSATDTGGVPPCLGAPGSAGHISMHAWH
jgi:hypothetical protein